MVLRTLHFLAVLTLLPTIWHARCQADEPDFIAVRERADDFASFCQFVDKEYAYFDQKRTDWARVCKSYAPLATAASGRDAYIEVLESALAELYDSHAHLSTNTRRSYRLVPTQTDLFATWRGDDAIITDVRRGSEAEQAGLRPGMEVAAIDGEPVSALVSSIEPKFLSREDPAARQWALQVALAGRRDRQVVRLRVKMGENTREFVVARVFPQPVSVLSSRVIGSVGYVRINNSLGQRPLIPAFDKALSEMPEVAGLVIDLRDTPSGGNSTVARGLLGRFVDKTLPYQRHELVAEFRETGIRRLWVEYVAPRESPFLKPVVVLVGRWTGSMGEGLAIGLNAVRSAPVLGQPMARLVGANGEAVLPHSKIIVRVPAEKLLHIDGTPREAVVPCPAAPAASEFRDEDQELTYAVALALELSAGTTAHTLHPTCFGLRP